MPTMRMPSTSASLSTLSAAQPALEQDVRALDDLVGEPVVEVVVHLRDELVVVQGLQIEVVVAIDALFRIVERCCIVEF